MVRPSGRSFNAGTAPSATAYGARAKPLLSGGDAVSAALSHARHACAIPRQDGDRTGPCERPHPGICAGDGATPATKTRSASKPGGWPRNFAKLVTSKRGTDQQYQRHRDLRGNDQASSAMAIGGAGNRPAAVTQDTDDIGARALHGRIQTEHDARQQRQREGRQQHGNAEGDVVRKGEIVSRQQQQAGQRPGKRPTLQMPAATELRSRLSTRNWRTSRPREAPRATRSPISCRRPVKRTSKRLATLAQATTSSRPTAASSVNNDEREAPMISSRSERAVSGPRGIGVGRIQLAVTPREDLQLAIRLLDRDAGLEAANRLKIAVAAANGVFGHAGRLERIGGKDVGIPECRQPRRDADNRER